MSIISAHPVDPSLHCRHPPWLEPTDSVKGSRQSRSSSQLTCRNKSAAVSTEPEMSNNGHGSSTQKRFSGDGNSVAAEYKMQKR